MSESTQRRLNTLSWILPEAYWGILSDAAFYLQHPDHAALLRNNLHLHRRYEGQKRCFVIGSGPSLKTQNLKPLQHEYTIVANSFFQHPDVSTISPKYCCIGDPQFTAGHPESVAWLRVLEKKLPNTTLVFRPSAKAVFSQHNLFRNHEVYYAATGLGAKTSSRVRIDLTRPINVGFTTGTCLSIPLALYLGFKEIYLLGYDADWLFQPSSAPFHFYEHNPHFPQFDKQSTMDGGMEVEIHTLYFEFRSHRLLREKAETMGARIFNATRGGKLDMYPRVSFESLF